MCMHPKDLISMKAINRRRSVTLSSSGIYQHYSGESIRYATCKEPQKPCNYFGVIPSATYSNITLQQYTFPKHVKAQPACTNIPLNIPHRAAAHSNMSLELPSQCGTFLPTHSSHLNGNHHPSCCTTHTDSQTRTPLKKKDR